MIEIISPIKTMTIAFIHFNQAQKKPPSGGFSKNFKLAVDEINTFFNVSIKSS